MSTASIGLIRPIPISKSHDRQASSPWLIGVTALVIGVAFFAAGHDLRISQAEGYTQSADEMEIAAAGGNLLRRAAFVLLAAWGCMLWACKRTLLNVAPLLVASIVLLVSLAAASFAWSDDPAMCARRLVALVCCAIAAAGVARALSPREICWMAVFVLGGLVVAGLLSELLLGTFRPWGANYRFSGTVHPNTQGATLATLCFASLALTDTSSRIRPWLWLVVAASLGLLLLTKSRGACAATAMAISITQLTHMRTGTKWAMAVLALPLAPLTFWLLCVFGSDSAYNLRELMLLGRAEDADTLSGRSLIWPEIFRFVGERPWLGYGYESFWTASRIDDISETVGWGLREAHNGYFEIVLWLGIAGLALLLMVAVAGLAAAWRAWRSSGSSAYLLPVSLIIFGLGNACFESGMVVVGPVPFILGCSLLRMALFRDAGVPTNE